MMMDFKKSISFTVIYGCRQHSQSRVESLVYVILDVIYYRLFHFLRMNYSRTSS